MKTYLRYLLPCVLAASTLLAGCGRDKPPALIQSAKEYLAKDDPKAAIIQLKTALQQEPESPEARFLLGRALLDSGDPVSAEIELRKASTLKYRQAAVVPALARALNLAGQYQKVTQQYADLDLAEPAAVADLKTSIATAYARQGDRKQADAAIETALKAVPEFGAARLVQARLKVGDGDVDGAFRLLDAILAKAPNDYEAWEVKGQLLFSAKGDATAAREALGKAVAIKNDYMAARSSLVTIALAERNIPEGKVQIEAIKKIAPYHAQTILFEGQIALLDKDYKLARERAQQLLKAAPDNPKFLQLAGAAEFHIGSMLQAANFLSKSLQSLPDAIPTRLLLAQAQLRMDEPARALETLAPLLKPPSEDSQAFALAAQANLQTGEFTKAEELFGKAAKSNPNDIASRTALALAQFFKGNPALGYTQLQEIAASDTTGTVADMALISVYYRRGLFEAALRAIDALEKKQPKGSLASNLRGQIQLAAKDVSAARQSFEKALAIDSTDVPAATSLAVLDIAEKKPELAKKRFDAILKIDPKNVRVLLAVAELRTQAGASKEEVAGLLRDAVRLNPTAVAPRLVLVDHLVKSKDIKAALAVAQEGVAALPESPELVNALGSAQLAAGDTNQAIKSFGRLAEIRPKSPEPQLRLAEAYLALKNNAAARQSLEQALAITPNLVAAQRQLVRLELASGRHKEALAIAKSVQRVPENEAIGSLFVGDVEATEKNWAAAATAYEASLNTFASTELAIKLHTVLLAAGKTAAADEHASRWLKEHPQDVVFPHYLGDRALSQNNYTVAETHYLAVLQRKPTDPVLLNNLAVVTTRLKKPGALPYAEKANELRPGVPEFMDSLAMILAENNQLGKALDLEKKVVDLRPKHAPFRLNLARLHIQAGDKGRAKEELERLAKLGEKFNGQAEVNKLLKAL